MFEKLKEGIYRLCVPFYDIYTTVFLLTEGEHCLLADCATTDEDVTEYIVPALERLGVKPTGIICSHMHGDHSGGLEMLRKIYPGIPVALFSQSPEYEGADFYHLADGEIIADRFQMLNLQGHCEESLGIFDRKTGTLLTFDSLQLYGVSRWGTGVSQPEAYLETIHRVSELAPQEIITSHDYVPYGYRARGAAEVKRYLEGCQEALTLVWELADSHPRLDAEEAAQLYRQKYPNLPIIGGNVIEALRKGGK